MKREIKIVLKNLKSRQEIYIDLEKEKLFFNGEEKEVDVLGIASRIFSIISNWKDNYYSDAIVDGGEFSVSFFDGKRSRKISGRGLYPQNFKELAKLIGEVQNA